MTDCRTEAGELCWSVTVLERRGTFATAELGDVNVTTLNTGYTSEYGGREGLPSKSRTNLGRVFSRS